VALAVCARDGLHNANPIVILDCSALCNAWSLKNNTRYRDRVETVTHGLSCQVEGAGKDMKGHSSHPIHVVASVYRGCAQEHSEEPDNSRTHQDKTRWQRWMDLLGLVIHSCTHSPRYLERASLGDGASPQSLATLCVEHQRKSLALQHCELGTGLHLNSGTSSIFEKAVGGRARCGIHIHRQLARYVLRSIDQAARNLLPIRWSLDSARIMGQNRYEDNDHRNKM
jgi:hypothetical protein